MVEVKFCGLTRHEDAFEATRMGADYVGVIFAGGPRLLSAQVARSVLGHVAGGARRVGVFGASHGATIASTADAAELDIVQLHADPDAEIVRAVRAIVRRPVWAALRVGGTELPGTAAELFAEADAVVLDARADHALGGTGSTLPWASLAAAIAPLRERRARLVLAGGLTPLNVAAAVAALRPDIVDVSSGVESAPGVKDHQLMRAFFAAARSNPRAA